MTEQEAVIALNMISGIGSQRLKKLLEAFGGAPKVFLASESKLKKIEGIGDKIAQEITSFRFDSLKNELDLAKKLKAKIVTVNDEEYPQNLKNIYDPPICLYLNGEFKKEDCMSLAIVGSRRASFYGLTCAERFAFALSSLGISVVSGLARGVDTRAHNGALKAKGRTLAVLGSGLNCIYPPENKKLAEGIAERGVVISEFPLNAKPLAHNFPRRNRVISGLSQGVIVVEAAKNSGALITADFALEQGREVFAVPGKVDSATSFGTNQLIKQGAKLIDRVEDILEELSGVSSRRYEQIKGAKPRADATCSDIQNDELPLKCNFSDEEKLVYNLLTDKPRPADELIEEVGLPAAKTMSLLSRLEMHRAVKQLPGKLFIKKEPCCG